MENSCLGPETISNLEKAKCWCAFYINDENMVMMEHGAIDDEENLDNLGKIFAALRYTNFIQEGLKLQSLDAENEDERYIINRLLYEVSNCEADPTNRDFISPLMNEVKSDEQDRME